MTPPAAELNFEQVLGAYNALWDMGGKVANVMLRSDWLLEYRGGLRGAYSRILTVDRHYSMLHEYQARAEKRGAVENPNVWAVECEYHAGAILFGMDSSLECLVYALNAIGFARDATAFRDITDSTALRKIRPDDILGGSMSPALGGYVKYFPTTSALWSDNATMLRTLFNYHDASKHRSAIVQGGSLGDLRIREDPKNPANHASSGAETMQTLAVKYQIFVDDAFVAMLGDIASCFGFSITMKQITPAV
jgi:hypothetical protein